MVVLGIFIMFILVGVAVFATYKGSTSTTALPSISIWGTFPKSAFDQYLAKINLNRTEPIHISYTQKSESAFGGDFIAALARGQGPDAILIPADMLLPHLDKITPIPFSALSQRDFMNIFIQEGEMYITSSGVNAMPFAVDPLVMYWNRNAFADAGIASPPLYWQDFSGDYLKNLTVLDQNGNIRKTAVALGDFSNVLHSREILASLLLSAGDPISKNSEGFMESAFRNDQNAVSSLQFFTSFVDPNKNNYSWNRAMPDSKTAFLSGILSVYFGFASEIKDIQAKNPNLNFDVAALPQWKGLANKAIYGKMYGFSIVRSSALQNAAYQIIAILDSKDNLPELSSALYLPSVRRDIISAGSSDPYMTIFNKQALIAKSWYDADPSRSLQIFSTMTNDVTSGAKSARDAMVDAADKYDVALKQAVQ